MASQNADEMAPKDVLFEAITTIKRGHNKPNTARICAYLQRKYDLTPNRCIKAINHYSSTGEIVAVNVGAPAADLSYRVADPPCLDALNALKGSMINKFVAELIINEPNYLTEGVPPGRLVSFVAQKQPNLSRKEILDSIQAELSLGNLDTFENGNYGYFPLDSSDEEEPEDKKRKLNSPSKSKTTSPPSQKPLPHSQKPLPLPSQKPSPKPAPVPSKVNGTKLSGGAKGNVGEKSATVAAEPKREQRKSVNRFENKEDRKENKEERKENVKKVEEKSGEIKEMDEGGRRRRIRKRKCYVDRDDDFQPGSKDFKVDLSLERQARKRKEKKIFDPSALESKTRKRGSGVQGQNNISPSTSNLFTSGTKKLISPAKKLLPGSSVKVGSGPGVQLPPGGRTNITPLVPSSVCYLCQTYGKRVKGVPEKLISCVKCSTSKAHISCLNDARNPNEKPLHISSPVNEWSCAKCTWSYNTTETCVYCNEFKAGIYILECIECKSGFHVPCHKGLIPLLSQQDSIVPEKFKCVRCETPQVKGSQNQSPPPTTTPKSEKPKPRPIIVTQQNPPGPQPKVTVSQRNSPAPQPKVTVTQLRPKVTSVAVGPDNSTSQPNPPVKVDSKLGFNNNLVDPHPQFPEDPKVPDCKSWTSMDVYKYLSERLIQDVCQQVLDADVDGKALLLLKRSDCFDILDLPIGFGVKLWCQVRLLQTRKSDIELFYGEF